MHEWQSERVILMVEDNPSVLKLNREVVESSGYQVKTAATIAQARTLLNTETVHLILLDIMMPDGSGLDFCQEIRAHWDLPILMLSSKRTSQDIVTGLRTGGDDYMTKPYRIEELLARIEALLRREKRNAPPNRANELVTCVNLQLNTISRRGFIDGQDLNLTPKEFALLLFFVQNQGRIVSMAEIFDKVWGAKSLHDTRLLWTHISKIRNKLAVWENTQFRLAAVKGKGYLFTVEL